MRSKSNKRFVIVRGIVYYRLDEFYTARAITIGNKTYASYKRYFHTRVVHRNNRISIGKIICFPFCGDQSIENLIKIKPSLERVRGYLEYLNEQNIGMKHQDGSSIDHMEDYWNLVCHHRGSAVLRNHRRVSPVQITGFNHQEYVEFKRELNRFPFL